VKGVFLIERGWTTTFSSS